MAEIRFLCIRCKSKIAAPEIMKSQRFKCPNCGQPMTVPEESEPGLEKSLSSNVDGAGVMTVKDNEHGNASSSVSSDIVDSRVPELSHLHKTVKDPVQHISTSSTDKPLPASEPTVNDPLLAARKGGGDDVPDRTIKMENESEPEMQPEKKRLLSSQSLILISALSLFFIIISAVIIWITKGKQAEKDSEKELEKELKRLRYSDVFKPAKHNSYKGRLKDLTEKEEAAKKIWSRVNRLLEGNALDNADKITTLCAEIKKKYPDTTCALKAEAAEKILKKKILKKEKSEVIEKLKRSAKSLAEQGRPQEAANVFLNYSGKLAVETIEERQKLANLYLKNIKPARLQKTASFKAIPENFLLENLIKKRFKFLASEIKKKYPDTDSAIVSLINELAKQNDIILSNINKAKGKIYPFTVKGKTNNYKIIKVEEGKIYLEYDLKKFKLIEKIKPDRLTMKDKIDWSKGMSKQALAVAEGLDFCKQKKFGEAFRCFKKSGILSRLLCGYVQKTRHSYLDKLARKAFLRLFKKNGIKLSVAKGLTPQQFFSLLSRRKYSKKEIQRMLKDINAYKRRFKESDYVKSVEDVLSGASEALQEKLENTGEEKKSEVSKNKRKKNKYKKFKIKSAADLHSALVSVNPKYEGNGKIDMDKKKIIGVVLRNRHIKDISPLAGLPIEYLDVSKNKNLTDFSPLTSCKKLKSLNAADTGLRDISFLADKPLVFLNIRDTEVADISPLKGKRNLKELIIAGNKNIKDISALKGIKLSLFNAAGTSVKEMSPLKNAPLTVLDISRTNVTDLNFLRGKKKLRKLFFNKCRIKNIRVLKNFKLTDIGFSPEYYDKKALSFLTKMETLSKIHIKGEKLSVEKFWIFFNGGKYKK